MDLILSKKDSVNVAGREWDAKWTPAIQGYAASLSSKSARGTIKEMEEMFKGEWYDCDRKSDIRAKRQLYFVLLLSLQGMWLKLPTFFLYIMHSKSWREACMETRS